VQRRARILAIGVSAVLGVLGGVVTGVLLDRPHGIDPLRLGVTMVDQPCTGDFVVVTGWGTSEPALGPGVSRDIDQAHYLDIDRSCPTAWKPQGTRLHGYIAYLGPYDSAFKACSERVTRPGSFVTQLDEGNTTVEQCLCVLSADSMPHLKPGMVVDAQTGIYVRALQALLATMQLMPPDHHFNGFYDPLTVRAIKRFQEAATLPQNGVVDVETWRAVTRQGCQQVTD
jgi:Putative peptidoglycan binding domain